MFLGYHQESLNFSLHQDVNKRVRLPIFKNNVVILNLLNLDALHNELHRVERDVFEELDVGQQILDPILVVVLVEL